MTVVHNSGFRMEVATGALANVLKDKSVAQVEERLAAGLGIDTDAIARRYPA